ncbi:MAG: hypothetical protein ACPGYY_06090 [Bacteroidia bacterium]
MTLITRFGLINGPCFGPLDGLPFSLPPASPFADSIIFIGMAPVIVVFLYVTFLTLRKRKIENINDSALD